MRVVAKTDKPLEVLPLPLPPAGVTDLKLIGKWQISCRMPDKIKCGEISEITLTIYGNTPVINFHPPQFDIPDARVYPPEVKRSENGVTVKYLLIPLKEGKKSLVLAFAVFDPETGKYNISRNDLEYTVLPGAVNTAVAEKFSQPLDRELNESSETDNRMQRGELPFTPVPQRKSAAIPLLSSNIFWMTVILLLSAVLLIMDFIAGAKRRNRESNQQKSLQKQKLKKLISMLKKSTAPAEVFHQEGLGSVAEALGLPPGATAGEIAEKIDVPELKRFFTDLASAGFNPGAKVSENPELLTKLCRWLKHLMIFLIVAGGFLNLSAKMYDKGHEAFEKGKYAEAKTFFSQSIDPDSPDPAAYFNSGCAAAMLGEYPLATLRFEQALLLAPWNSEFRNAHRQMLDKIPGHSASEERSFGEFVISLRDRLRPDNYLLLSSVMVLGIVITYCLRHRMMRGYRYVIQGILLLLMLLCLLSAYTQFQSTYSSARGRIKTGGAPLRSLPVLSTGEIITTLPGGTEIRITETRPGWYRITSPHYSGWIKQDDVNGILPGKFF